MSELGECIAVSSSQEADNTVLELAITAITFKSGIECYGFKRDKTAEIRPPGSDPHWRSWKVYPAVYVRKGGSGETKACEIDVKWTQQGCDGTADLIGTSDDGKIRIEGKIDIKGERGKATITAELTEKPDKVANYGAGVTFDWTVKAKGKNYAATGGSPLKLFFVDRKPRPIGWSGTNSHYKKHYIKVIDWATKWASGKATEKPVFDAIWDEFSTGSGARVPHTTGYAYWKRNTCIQELENLVKPGEKPRFHGWSCRAIAHLFMECLALHGIACQEVIPQVPAGRARVFLVANWERRPATIPNWPSDSSLYYGGSGSPIDTAPTWSFSPTHLKKHPFATAPTVDRGLLEIDMKKKPGIPAQGQNNAPPFFGNHWIVLSMGKLYDTSYGLEHPNDKTQYADVSIPGWVVNGLPDGGNTALRCRERGYTELYMSYMTKN